MMSSIDHYVTFEELAQTTTLHGMRHTMNKKRSKVQRVFWVLLIIASFTSFFYFMTRGLIRYFSHSVTTVEEIIPSTNLDMPSLTFCNHNLIRKSYINSLPESERMVGEVFKQLSPVSFLSRLDAAETLRNIRLQRLENYSMEVPASEGAHSYNQTVIYLKIGQTLNVIPAEMHESRLMQGGYCHTLQPASYIKKHGEFKVVRAGMQGGMSMMVNISQGEYYASMEGSAGLKLLVHAPYEEPLMNERSFSIPPGMHIKVMVHRKRTINLPAPYGSSNCIDTSLAHFKNPLQHFDDYTYDSCVFECVINYLYKTCGCRIVYYKGRSNIPACNVEQTLSCAINATIEYYESPSIEAACNCRQRCNHLTFSIAMSQAEFPSDDLEFSPFLGQSILDHRLSYLNIYYGELATEEYIQVISYPPEAAFGEIGGQMGICLGASLLTLAEFVEFFTRNCCTCARKAKYKVSEVTTHIDMENGKY